MTSTRLRQQRDLRGLGVERQQHHHRLRGGGVRRRERDDQRIVLGRQRRQLHAGARLHRQQHAAVGQHADINAADTAIVCTFTNTRKSATLTLAKTWVNGVSGDTATVTNSGFTNNATSGLSVSSGNNTTTGSPVTVFAGESGTISVSFSVGSAGNYTAVIACSGNATPLAGSTLTMNGADTAITCTFTDTRKSATLTSPKPGRTASAATRRR